MARKSEKKRNEAKPSRAPTKTDAQIAQTILKCDLPSSDPDPSGRDREAYDAFHRDLKKLHEPFLPVHFDTVERAAQLRWRLREISAFEDKLFIAMTDICDQRCASPQVAQSFMQLLEMLLCKNGLEKIAKYEAALGEETRKTDQRLEAILDWHITEGFKRGQIGYTTSRPHDRDIVLCYDEPPDDDSQMGNSDEKTDGTMPPTTE